MRSEEERRKGGGRDVVRVRCLTSAIALTRGLGTPASMKLVPNTGFSVEAGFVVKNLSLADVGDVQQSTACIGRAQSISACRQHAILSVDAESPVRHPATAEAATPITSRAETTRRATRDIASIVTPVACAVNPRFGNRLWPPMICLNLDSARS
jgi:hypothetical protein